MSENMPKAVYIQLHTDCNGYCTICPQPKAYNRFGFQRFDEDLYGKILLDLQEMDYSGILGLFLQCEPLMDDRLYDWIKLAKEETRASVEISTNGLLIKEQFEELAMSPVDRIYVNYGGVKYGKVPESIIQIVNELAYFKRVIINYPRIPGENDRMPDLFPGLSYNEFWASNRGGNIKSIKHDKRTRFTNCVAQGQQLNIVATGDVILCCNDYMRINKFGNAKDRNVIDIWREIQRHFDYPICRRCL